MVAVQATTGWRPFALSQYPFVDAAVGVPTVPALVTQLQATWYASIARDYAGSHCLGTSSREKLGRMLDGGVPVPVLANEVFFGVLEECLRLGAARFGRAAVRWSWHPVTRLSASFPQLRVRPSASGAVEALLANAARAEPINLPLLEVHLDAGTVSSKRQWEQFWNVIYLEMEALHCGLAPYGVGVSDWRATDYDLCQPTTFRFAPLPLVGALFQCGAGPDVLSLCYTGAIPRALVAALYLLGYHRVGVSAMPVDFDGLMDRCPVEMTLDDLGAHYALAYKKMSSPVRLMRGHLYMAIHEAFAAMQSTDAPEYPPNIDAFMRDIEALASFTDVWWREHDRPMLALGSLLMAIRADYLTTGSIVADAVLSRFLDTLTQAVSQDDRLEPLLSHVTALRDRLQQATLWSSDAATFHAALHTMDLVH